MLSDSFDLTGELGLETRESPPAGDDFTGRVPVCVAALRTPPWTPWRDVTDSSIEPHLIQNLFSALFGVLQPACGHCLVPIKDQVD